MGRKYGSLHIKAKNMNVSFDAVNERYNSIMQGSMPSGFGESAQKLGLILQEEQISILNAIMRDEVSETTQNVVEQPNGFISIYDKRMTFENIEEISRKMSAELNTMVLYASVYDDDVFLFGLCEDGTTISEYAGGECEAYGICKKNENVKRIVECLSLDRGNSECLCTLQCVAFENELARLLGFSLASK